MNEELASGLTMVNALLAVGHFMMTIIRLAPTHTEKERREIELSSRHLEEEYQALSLKRTQLDVERRCLEMNIKRELKKDILHEIAQLDLIRVDVPCPETGCEDGRVITDWEPCPDCRGRGVFFYWANDEWSHSECTRCDGEGEVESQRQSCRRCSGQGFVGTYEKVEVKEPWDALAERINKL